MSHNIKVLIAIIILILVFIGAIFMFNHFDDNQEYGLKIYFFNAGKADCILISHQEHYILIDTGEENLSDDILAYFNTNHITKLDYLIITHFDKDHVGSASEIINNIEVENVFQSNSPKESEYYTNYLNSLEEKGITPETISGNKSFTIGDLNFVVNGPTTVYSSNESNNSSLIVSMNYGDTNYLFMGDSQNDRIKDFLKEDSNQYDFLKVPYHGNYQKRLDDLLESVKPSYAVITCSSEEPDTTETEELLKENNISYYLTKNGSITVLSDGKNIIIKQ